MSNQIPIWIINLKRSKDRRQHMENLMNKYNLKYEFIEGVDADQLSKEELKKYLSPIKPLFKIGRFLTPGDVGCTLAHMKCWKKMQEENIEEAVVLEDDIFFNEKFAEFVKLKHKFPSDWEFINFSTPAKSVIFHKERIFDIYSFTKFIEPHEWLSAYALNLKGVKKLLDCLKA